MPVLVRSLKSRIVSSASFQLDKTFWGSRGSAAVDLSRRKANMVDQGDGKFGPEADPGIPQNEKIKI